jgi:rod shape-determining protein MreC
VGDFLSTPNRWIGDGVNYVTGYFFAVSENRRLKEELKEARRWRDVALAQADVNERYKALLKLRTDPPIPMVAARTVIDSRGPFANSRLANAGKEKGIRSGNPVMSETGLVGRVVGVTEGASRILLLTDIASRVPVMIDRTNARAILTGDGGPNPQLDYLRGRDPVREGDRVVTSGDGGVFPRGLPVGVAVKGLDGLWRVVLSSDRAPIDYVQVLLFQDFAQLSAAAAAELARAPAPPSANPPPELDVPAPPVVAPAGDAPPKPKTAAAAPAPGQSPAPKAPAGPVTPAPKTAATAAPTPKATPPVNPAVTPAPKTTAPAPKATTPAPKTAAPAAKTATPTPKTTTPPAKAASPPPKVAPPVPKVTSPPVQPAPQADQ